MTRSLVCFLFVYNRGKRSLDADRRSRWPSRTFWACLFASWTPIAAGQRWISGKMLVILLVINWWRLKKAWWKNNMVKNTGISRATDGVASRNGGFKQQLYVYIIIYIIRIVLGIWSGEIILIEWELTSGNHFNGLLEDNHLVRWFSAINLHLYRWCSIVALYQRSILIHELEILFLINQCSWMTRVNSALFCPDRFSDELATLMFVCHLFCCHVMLQYKTMFPYSTVQYTVLHYKVK